MSEFDDTSSKDKTKPFSNFEMENAEGPNKIPPAVQTEAQLINTDTLTFETNEEETLVKRRKKSKSQKSYFLFTSIITAIIWVAGSLFYLMDNQALGKTTLDQIGMIMAILGPAAFSILAGLLGEALAKSGRDARVFSVAARRLLEPPEGANDSSLSRLKIVREEIDRLERALDLVNVKLGGIDDKITQKARELVAVSTTAKEGADNLVSNLEEERKRLAAILDGLSELSRTTENTTKLATQSINDNAGLLNKAAEGLVERSQFASSQASLAANRLEEAMSKTLGAVSGLDEASLRGEQALARAHELLVLARVRSDDAVGGVSNAIEFLHEAAQNAADTAQKVSQLVSSETQNTRSLSIKTIEDVRTIAEDSANQIMVALRAEAENARLRAKEAVESFDQTNNAIRILTEDAAQRAASQFESIKQETFEISANADKMVDKTVSNAKEIIDASATILDETSERIKARFSELARTSMDQARAIEDIIAGLNDKLAQLPKEADERAKSIEIALEETLQRLNRAGQNAADEVRGLDSAFQSRLKASYEALGDVVGKLGSIPGIAPGLEVPKRETIKSESELAPEEFIPDPRKIIRNEKPNNIEPVSEPVAQAKPEITQKPIAEKEEPKVQSDQVEIDNKPIFASVLSPRIPVRSAPAINVTAPVTPKPDKSSPGPDIPLRGTIDQSENIAKAEQSETPKQEEKQPKSEKSPVSSADSDNPFGEFHMRQNIQTNATPNNWSWRDVLKSLDDTANKTGDQLIDRLLKEHNLRNILNDVVLERFTQNYLRDFEKARNQIRMALPTQTSILKRQLSEDHELRSNIVKFVETRRETMRHGRIKGDELRIYLFADSVLSA